MDLVTNKPLFPEVIQKFLKCIYLLYFNESNLRNICLLVFFSFSMELGVLLEEEEEEEGGRWYLFWFYEFQFKVPNGFQWLEKCLVKNLVP